MQMTTTMVRIYYLRGSVAIPQTPPENQLLLPNEPAANGRQGPEVKNK